MTTTQTKVGLYIGRIIYFSVADGYAVYKITKISKRVVHLEWVDDPSNNPDKYVDRTLGSKGSISINRLKELLSCDEFFINSQAASNRFFDSLKIGQIVHYNNGFNDFVRCEIDKEKNLVPIALVGEWDKTRLPHYLNGKIHYPFHADMIRIKNPFRPFYTTIFECPFFVTKEHTIDPRKLEPLSLEVPEPDPYNDPKNYNMTAKERVEKYRKETNCHPENIISILCEIIDKWEMSTDMMDFKPFDPRKEK